MSLFGFLGGAGAGAANIANQYISQELEMERQAALKELDHGYRMKELEAGDKLTRKREEENYARDYAISAMEADKKGRADLAKEDRQHQNTMELERLKGRFAIDKEKAKKGSSMLSQAKSYTEAMKETEYPQQLQGALAIVENYSGAFERTGANGRNVMETVLRTIKEYGDPAAFADKVVAEENKKGNSVTREEVMSRYADLIFDESMRVLVGVQEEGQEENNKESAPQETPKMSQSRGAHFSLPPETKQKLSLFNDPYAGKTIYHGTIQR